VQNAFFAGYVTFRERRVATVSARYLVPHLSCSKIDAATSPGVEIVTGDATARPHTDSAHVIIGCENGHPGAEATILINNKEYTAPIRVAAGDEIAVSVRDVSGGKVTARVRDLTRGRRFTFTRSGHGVRPHVETVGDDTPIDSRTNLPAQPPKFTPTTFGLAIVDGKAIGASQPQVDDMTTPERKLEVRTGALDKSGSIFTLRRIGAPS
jgi:hypothetical protein